MAGKGTLTVRVLGDTTQFNQSVGSVGQKLTRTLTPAALAAGAAFRKAGNDWNAGRNAIITGTGAAGKELSSMEKSMKRVGGRVPQDLGQVGVAIAEVNTRLALTGKPLESMSKKMLDLARITGGDVKQTVTDTTRLFGDWGLAAKDQVGALDLLVKAAQATGVGVDELSQRIVQFGAPLRQMGFTFEQSTAMLGKWHKEGVNTEAVLAGMKIGLGKMAKAGEDATKTFARVVGEIKNAGTEAEASAIAVEAFGTRAGPDMKAAVREGRFELDDLIETLGDSSGALDDAAKRTLRLGDRLSMFKNKVIGVVGPVGDMGMAVAGVALAIGPLMQVIPKLGKALTLLAANPVVLIIAAVAALAAGLIYAYKHSETFRNVVDTVGRSLMAAWDWVVKFGQVIFDLGKKVVGFYMDWTPTGQVLQHLPEILGLVRDAFQWVIDKIKMLIDWIKKLPGLIDKALGPLDELIGKTGKALIGNELRDREPDAKPIVPGRGRGGGGRLSTQSAGAPNTQNVTLNVDARGVAKEDLGHVILWEFGRVA